MGILRQAQDERNLMAVKYFGMALPEQNQRDQPETRLRRLLM